MLPFEPLWLWLYERQRLFGRRAKKALVLDENDRRIEHKTHASDGKQERHNMCISGSGAGDCFVIGFNYTALTIAQSKRFMKNLFKNGAQFLCFVMWSQASHESLCVLCHRLIQPKSRWFPYRNKTLARMVYH